MRNVDLFDDYLSGKLNAAEKNSFMNRLSTDAEFEKEFNTHSQFVQSLGHALLKAEMKKKLKALHEEEFGASNVVSILQPKHNYWKIAAVAAAVSLLIFAGGSFILKSALFGKKENDYQILKKIVKGFEDGLKNVKKDNKKIIPTANIEATGFSISSKGYFLTSLHAVKNADSVKLQNDQLDYVSAERVWEDENLDVAVFKLKNSSELKNSDVPISFRTGNIDLGEKVFALGYPRETIVYSEGNVSAASGLQGDTTKFQLSMLINPGNSGSPVLDEQGNLVGIISGRNNNAQGVSYAVKAEYILNMIKNIPDQKLRNEILVNGKNNIKKLKRTEQIKKLKPFVYNIMVYNSAAE